MEQISSLSSELEFRHNLCVAFIVPENPNNQLRRVQLSSKGESTFRGLNLEKDDESEIRNCAEILGKHSQSD